jgi:hypothetical protein
MLSSFFLYNSAPTSAQTTCVAPSIPLTDTQGNIYCVDVSTINPIATTAFSLDVDGVYSEANYPTMSMTFNEDTLITGYDFSSFDAIYSAYIVDRPLSGTTVFTSGYPTLVRFPPRITSVEIPSGWMSVSWTGRQVLVTSNMTTNPLVISLARADAIRLVPANVNLLAYFLAEYERDLGHTAPSLSVVVFE